MEQIITRFAPSPTGFLHIGNARTALINWLFAKKNSGKFILRIDDTDAQRSQARFEQAIENDLLWLGLEWDEKFKQSARAFRYEEAQASLIAAGRLYPCFETAEELEVKRKLRLASGKPPIYDRAALHLTAKQIADYKQQGRKPHYRFHLESSEISWLDLIRGEVNYKTAHLSDPIVVRSDGNMTYLLCSVIDDLDYNVTHIFRGEDHVTNTALQMQMFEALNKEQKKLPHFGHLSLVRALEEKISKRVGGFELASLKNDFNLEPMTINSFFTLIGSSQNLVPYKNLLELTNHFEVSSFSSSPTTYHQAELERLNHKLLINLDYQEVKQQIAEITEEPITEKFWLAARPNLNKLSEIKLWWQICYAPALQAKTAAEQQFLQQAAAALPPGQITVQTWSEWTKSISEKTGKKGKELFLPLRIALTGYEYGPEMKSLLPLLARQEILARLGI